MDHKWWEQIDPFFGSYEDDDQNVFDYNIETPSVEIQLPYIPLRTEYELAELFYGPCPTVHERRERGFADYWMSSYSKTLQ